MNPWIAALIYVIAAPFAGGLLAGIDRRITARMQRRVGPPLLQPFHDVRKLLEKENLVVNPAQHFYLGGFLLFNIVSGALFFAGGDLLIVMFALALASVFLVLAACGANSPFSHIGAERELLQVMACEPMLLIAALGLYTSSGSFQVREIMDVPHLLVVQLPGIFFGLLFILTIKLRKSPFDLSTSHHAHQELVKGVTTEFSGPALALIEVAHWYENMLLLGLVYLFMAAEPWLAGPVVALVYFLEILVDNTTARLKWQATLRSSWIVAATAGAINLVLLHYILKAGG